MKIDLVFFSIYFNKAPVLVSNNTLVVDFLLNNTGARYSCVPNWVIGSSLSNRFYLDRSV